MAVVVGILLAVLVVVVAIDTLARIEKPLPRDPAASTTEKVIVDLSKRR